MRNFVSWNGATMLDHAREDAMSKIEENSARKDPTKTELSLREEENLPL
jgi:hypothetical protein